jgi:hypothetical protein
MMGRYHLTTVYTDSSRPNTPKHTKFSRFSFLVSRPAAGISQGAGKKQKEVGDPRGAPWTLTITEPQKWCFFWHSIEQSEQFSIPCPAK